MGLVDNLCKLPATDGNFISALNQATKAQIQLAVKIMQINANAQNKTRIEACERKIRALDAQPAEPKEDTTTEVKPEIKPEVKPEIKTETKYETKTETSTTSKEKKSTEKEKTQTTEDLKIVEFPNAKPKIKELPKTDEKHTYDECVRKMVPTKLKYKDEDNIYVIDGIMNKCKEDQDFRNNFMRKEKTYDGFYQYMFNAARAGYCVKVGNSGGMLTKEKALELAFDYFNMSEIIKPEEKKEVAKKLTKEVNKIADEVKKEARNTKQKKPESKPSDEGQIPGQLKFDF